ncbi:zinc ABC transporter substrate-binding protein [Boudabousia liubingyangii]|uniref:Zinc ABC transporter substrate-binding protein n=1 Tax=Boudabousia liubingyangii TaxID=1921764 RepID=A0A1Q5PKR4_9ACTO|nr:metal ABC transporter substrate-binding protein [Boudabousia liubingyangii]OKL47222.1 zinc ABC transporter substrate-binding protein [Boudabousia liubingyangii]
MKPKKPLTLAALIAATGMILSACAVTPNSETGSSNANTATGKATNKTLKIVATTGYLGDAIKNIAPEAEVQVLVQPGGDPHTQELTTKDTEAIANADLVVWTSHDMEHKMMAQFDKMGDKQLPAAESPDIEPLLLPWEEDGKVEGHDPHVWNSPDIWMKVVTNISNKLGKVDPDNLGKYQENAKAYNQKIEAARGAAQKEFDKIPVEKRVLITGHDAFNYLGKTFNIEIHATDFVSSESEMSAKQLDDLANLIATKQVPVIFQDNLKNPKAIENLQKAVKSKGWEVKVSDQELYADTLGTEAPLDTYLGAFEHNAQTISKALSSK